MPWFRSQRNRSLCDWLFQIWNLDMSWQILINNKSLRASQLQLLSLLLSPASGMAPAANCSTDEIRNIKEEVTQKISIPLLVVFFDVFTAWFEHIWSYLNTFVQFLNIFESVDFRFDSGGYGKSFSADLRPAAHQRIQRIQGMRKMFPATWCTTWIPWDSMGTNGGDKDATNLEY